MGSPCVCSIIFITSNGNIIIHFEHFRCIHGQAFELPPTNGLDLLCQQMELSAQRDGWLSFEGIEGILSRELWRFTPGCESACFSTLTHLVFFSSLELVSLHGSGSFSSGQLKLVASHHRSQPSQGAWRNRSQHLPWNSNSLRLRDAVLLWLPWLVTWYPCRLPSHLLQVTWGPSAQNWLYWGQEIASWGELVSSC